MIFAVPGDAADHHPHFKTHLEGAGLKIQSAETVAFKHTFANEKDAAEFFFAVDPQSFETNLGGDDGLASRASQGQNGQKRRWRW